MMVCSPAGQNYSSVAYKTKVLDKVKMILIIKKCQKLLMIIICTICTEFKKLHGKSCTEFSVGSVSSLL